jgi:hypothetical protein
LNWSKKPVVFAAAVAYFTGEFLGGTPETGAVIDTGIENLPYFKAMTKIEFQRIPDLFWLWQQS